LRDQNRKKKKAIENEGVGASNKQRQRFKKNGPEQSVGFGGDLTPRGNQHPRERGGKGNKRTRHMLVVTWIEVGGQMTEGLWGRQTPRGAPGMDK